MILVLLLMRPVLRFHALPSVAPLKLSWRSESGTRVPGFHALPSVAPLKRLKGPIKPVDPQRFHALPSVAPLKQGKQPTDMGWKNEFPRSTERGPIEAPTCRSGTLRAFAVSTLYRAWPH